jgi:hypothetical protein
MINLTAALGANGSIYESIAMKIVAVVDSSAPSTEVGVIAIKAAQLVLEARERDAWDATWG